MNIIRLVIYSTITILILEYLSKRNIKKLLLLKPYALFVNVLILIDIYLLFTVLTKNFQTTLIVVTIITIIFGIANRIKIDYRQTGFTPLDFLILREAKSMAGALNKKSMLNLVITALISLIILLLLAQLISEPILETNFKNSIVIISIVIPLIFYLTGPLYNQKISVFKLGTIFYFFSYLNDPPKIRIAKRKRDLESTKSSIEIKTESPNVIIIQSESFIDPFVLGKDKFNKDPLPLYRTILNESYSFSMSTRAFGGGTVHTEYEVLTGLSTVFFPRDTTVFSRYIKDSLPSIGSILHNQGYKSLLIHPYLEWYYNRTSVYRKLGFDRFLTLKSFESTTKDYVKDIDVFNRILNELDKGSNLIVAVTMQNHTPYNNNLYNNGVEFQGNISNPETKLHFDNFLNGLTETDKSLSHLINELKKRDKETILLFYGDHLPVINQDATFYKESLWSKAKFDSWKYYYDLSKSPGFIWSNKRNITGNKNNIDTTGVLPILLKELNVDFPDYIKKTDILLNNDSINGFFRDFLIKDGDFYDSVHPIYKKLYNNLKDINSVVFNDIKYDKWCYENDTYEVN